MKEVIVDGRQFGSTLVKDTIDTIFYVKQMQKRHNKNSPTWFLTTSSKLLTEYHLRYADELWEQQVLKNGWYRWMFELQFELMLKIAIA